MRVWVRVQVSKSVGFGGPGFRFQGPLWAIVGVIRRHCGGHLGFTGCRC